MQAFLKALPCGHDPGHSRAVRVPQEVAGVEAGAAGEPGRNPAPGAARRPEYPRMWAGCPTSRRGNFEGLTPPRSVMSPSPPGIFREIASRSGLFESVHDVGQGVKALPEKRISLAIRLLPGRTKQ